MGREEQSASSIGAAGVLGRMRIAYLGIKGLPSQWGADRVVEAVALRLAARHHLTVYCNSRHTPRGTKIPGIQLVRIPTLPGKHLQPVLYFTLSAIHAVFQNYDAVHIHNAEACFVVPLLRLRHRVIATSHGAAYAREKWGRLGKRLIRLLDASFVRFPNVLTSVSLPLTDEYRMQYGKSIHYLPNGVDAEPTLDLAAAAKTLQKNQVSADYILFAAGRLDPTKGCHLLLNAYSRVEMDEQLVIVGNTATLPSYGEELKRIADERVRFIPFISSKGELFGIVRGARVFAFPSMVEAMSMMLLEVASLGVPVICSDIPENSEVLREHALYFRSGDVNDLTDKLRWALNHVEKMARLGKAAMAWVHDNYSWDVIAERYEKLYEDLVRITETGINLAP